MAIASHESKRAISILAIKKKFGAIHFIYYMNKLTTTEVDRS